MYTVPDMRKPLDAQFVNSSGLDEVGYGQGVNRAFIQQLGLWKSEVSNSS